MIRGIILYYLNIKPTHGYEIQQFIQMSGIDQWTKIQSGSIYYALTKLEKEKNISVLREERTGSRIRKIYEITDEGREALKEEMRQELAAPLFNTGSFKFITAPIFDSLSKDEMVKIIENHINELNEVKDYWNMWSMKKSLGDKHGLTSLSFKITIDSIENQILWHKELLDHIDYYIEESKTMGMMIASFDSESLKESEVNSKNEDRLEFLNSIKEALSKNPEAALDNINSLIEEIKKEK